MARTTIKDLEARFDATLPALEERIEALEAENAKLRRLVEQNGTGKPRPPAPNARSRSFHTPQARADRYALRRQYFQAALADGCNATNVPELDAWIAANVS